MEASLLSGSFRWAVMLGLLVGITGCGTLREQGATDQLLLSDAVDRCVAQIDFTPLSGETIFFDTTFIPQSKPTNGVSSGYIVSSLRQQMLQAGCLLQDAKEQADFVVEARIGALAADGHDINIGVPASNALNSAASLVSSAPPLPSLPEVSFVKRKEDSAAAKIAVFAYHRESKRPIWQSGLSLAKSRARNRWILGAGPFQSGEIYSGTYFAGGQVKPRPFSKQHPPDWNNEQAYRNAAIFDPKIQQKLRERWTGEILAHDTTGASADAAEQEQLNGDTSDASISVASREEKAEKDEKK